MKGMPIKEPVGPIQARLFELVDQHEDWDLKNLSLAIGRNHAYLHQFIFEGTPRRLDEYDRKAIVEKLGIDEDDLVEAKRRPARGLAEDSAAFEALQPGAAAFPMQPLSGPLPRDLPVRGSPTAGDGDIFDMGPHPIDYIQRPPGLAGVETAYAVRVVGTSMEPRYMEGEAAYVNPARPITPGCFVAVEFFPTVEGEIGTGVVKQFVRRTPTKLILAQFNPKNDKIEFPLDRVKAIHRIVLGGEG